MQSKTYQLTIKNILPIGAHQIESIKIYYIMQQAPPRKINRDNPSKLILIFDPNPKQDYFNLLSTFPFNAEAFVDLIAKSKFQYVTTIQVINPAELTGLQARKVSGFDTCTIIFLEGSGEKVIDILSNPIFKESLFKIYANRLEQSTLFLISLVALQRQVICNFLDNYMSCVVLQKNSIEQDPEAAYKKQIWSLIDRYHSAKLQTEQRNSNNIIGTFNYNSKYNNIFNMVFKIVDGELTQYQITYTKSSFYVPMKEYVNLKDSEAVLQENNYTCHQGRFQNKIIQQGYDRQKQAEGIFQDGKLIKGTVQASDLNLEARIVYQEKQSENVLSNEMVVKQKDFEGVCFEKLYNQGRIKKGDSITEEGYFHEENQGIYEGVIKKNGIVTQIKEIKNNIKKTWEFEIGSLKVNNYEQVVISNAYNILTKATQSYFDIECLRQNFKLEPGQLTEKLESLYNKFKPEELLHFIISDQSEIAELYTLIREFRSQGIAFKNKGVPAEMYVLITDLTDTKLEDLKFIEQCCFETFFLKRIQENKFTLLSERADIDVLIQKPNEKYIAVQMKGNIGVYEVILEGDKAVSSVLLRSSPPAKK